jgi:hypothetical protein
MTIEGLIDLLQQTASAAGPLGGLLPVVVEAPDGPLRYRPWLETGVKEIYTHETGERTGKSGHTSYAALVIRASHD